MNRRVIALGLCVLATVTGCSTTSGSENRDDSTASADQQINGEDLSGADVCELVPQKFVADHLQVEITGTRAWDRDKKPVTIAACRYEMSDRPSQWEASVEVSIWPGRVNAKDRVKTNFTGYTGENASEYEEVNGLGDAAGFGPLHEIPNLYGLEVVSAYDDAYRSIDVNVSSPKPPTLEQMRPIAERMLQKLTK